jgi:hypothetical protein
VFFFSSCVSILTCSTTSSSASSPFMVTCNSIIFVLARNCTSCATLTCSLYNAFVGILVNTNCTYTRSLSGIWAMASLTYNISVVIQKLGLVFTMIWIVSSYFCAVLSFSFFARGIDYVPLYFLCIDCIYYKTYLMSANLFVILPLWFSTSSKSFVAKSCTLSMRAFSLILSSRYCVGFSPFGCMSVMNAISSTSI